MKKTLFMVIVLVAAFLLTAFVSDSFAVVIVGDTTLSSEHLADFYATLNYSYLGSNTATLTIALKNTTPIANGGYLTQFLFNNPSDAITGVTMSSTNSHFVLLGAPTFNGSANTAGNYGYFDIGSKLTNGNPNRGIGVNGTDTFTFNLSGTSGLAGLTDMSFVNALSSGVNGGTFFLTKFQGVNPGNVSDEVPGKTDNGGGGGSTPEPATLSLLGLGIVALYLKKRNK